MLLSINIIDLQHHVKFLLMHCRFSGNQPPTPEVEPLDIPDDLDMGGDSSGEDEENKDEENPFDIDKMKGKLCS